MSLPPGLYLIRNRATGYYVLPDNGTDSGASVTTTTVGDDVPTHATISVQKDPSGLYTLKSASDLSIGDSEKIDGNGHRYLVWQDGDFKLEISSAGPALWNIKLPNDPLYATDDRPSTITMQPNPPGREDKSQNAHTLVIPIIITIRLPNPGSNGGDGDQHIILKGEGSPSAARWEFINAGV